MVWSASAKNRDVINNIGQQRENKEWLLKRPLDLIWRDLAKILKPKDRQDSYLQSGVCCGALGDLEGAESLKIYLTFPTLSRLRSIGLAQLMTARRPISRAIIFLPS